MRNQPTLEKFYEILLICVLNTLRNRGEEISCILYYSLDTCCEIDARFSKFLIFLSVSHTNTTRRKIDPDVQKSSPSGAVCL